MPAVSSIPTHHLFQSPQRPLLPVKPLCDVQHYVIVFLCPSYNVSPSIRALRQLNNLKYYTIVILCNQSLVSTLQYIILVSQHIGHLLRTPIN